MKVEYAQLRAVSISGATDILNKISSSVEQNQTQMKSYYSLHDTLLEIQKCQRQSQLNPSKKIWSKIVMNTTERIISN